MSMGYQPPKLQQFDDANHASIDVVTSDLQHKVPSLSSSAKAPPALQFGSLDPAMVKVLLADEGTMNEEKSIDKFEEDGEWILVTRRWRQRRCIDELHPLFLKKSYSPTVRKPNPMKVLKTPHVNFKKPSKMQEALPLKASTSSHVGGNQAKSVVVGHIPQLLEKSGYDFSNPSGLGKLEPELTGETIYGLTKAQHKLRKQGYQVDQPKTGMGFALAELVRIRVTKKEKCVNVQHISIEGDGKGKKPSDDRVSAFDRLSTPTARPSVFGRLGSSSRIPNVQDTLGASSIPQSSVFNRLGGGSTQQLKKRNHAGETDTTGSRNNNQTLILSQPQGSKSSLVLIAMDGTVKESFISSFKALKPELCITAAYGYILPTKFLKIHSINGLA
ncbi:hypothetical protein BUALT_Bualt06G0060800 [Buddleja alternifolia]|uniref:Uncharacterized protein n=1 Tax=Buddleja alternifolia TaxID=168488 RepID=A0AAV6XD47_9LAMI|nr:hypothetical protein BUALT_Bualt06G0060800 [Buddleja alternifolia]